MNNFLKSSTLSVLLRRCMATGTSAPSGSGAAKGAGALGGKLAGGSS